MLGVRLKRALGKFLCRLTVPLLKTSSRLLWSDPYQTWKQSQDAAEALKDEYLGKPRDGWGWVRVSDERFVYRQTQVS